MNLRCGRCGLPKREFQTIKFGDIFPHMLSSHQQEECRCEEDQCSVIIQHNNNQQQQHKEPDPLPLHDPFQFLQQQQPQPQLFYGGSLQPPQHAFIPYDHGEGDVPFLEQKFSSQLQLPQPEEALLGGSLIGPEFGSMTLKGGDEIVRNEDVQQVQSSVIIMNGGGGGSVRKGEEGGVAAAPPPTPPARVPCHLCKKTFVNEKMKVTHVKRVHEKVSRFVCEICGAAFSYRGSLDSHLCSHNAGLGTSHECTVCGQKFKEKSNLNQHMRYHSDNPKRFFCSYCPSGFTKKVNLRYHMKRKHPEQEQAGGAQPASSSTAPSDSPKNLDIPTSVEASSSSSLPESEKGGDGSFKCEQCGRSFLFKNNLKAHLRTHSKEKKYTCQECQKSFIYKESLKNHMLLHSNELPYHCEICGKKFRDRSNRRKHVKNVHKYILNNNNNNNEEGVRRDEAASSMDSSHSLSSPTNGLQQENKNGLGGGGQRQQQQLNVIKIGKKQKDKKGTATPTAPNTGTTSVIVSNSASADSVRKIIMSPVPPAVSDSSELLGSPCPAAVGVINGGQSQSNVNVIVKVPPQMQNVIVYPSSKLRQGNGMGDEPLPFPSTLSDQGFSSFPARVGHGGEYGHFTISRGIITTPQHFQPQQQQELQYSTSVDCPPLEEQEQSRQAQQDQYWMPGSSAESMMMEPSDLHVQSQPQELSYEFGGDAMALYQSNPQQSQSMENEHLLLAPNQGGNSSSNLNNNNNNISNSNGNNTNSSSGNQNSGSSNSLFLSQFDFSYL